jgi:hypothetical protein
MKQVATDQRNETDWRRTRFFLQACQENMSLNLAI